MMHCCFCKKVRPKNWRAQNWTGVQIGGPSKKSHWACNDHPDMDVVYHARDVSDGKATCEEARPR